MSNFVSFNDFQNNLTGNQIEKKPVQSPLVIKDMPNDSVELSSKNDSLQAQNTTNPIQSNDKLELSEKAQENNPSQVQENKIQENQAQETNETTQNQGGGELENPNSNNDLEKELKKAKRQNGLIEKVADKIKGATGLGISSKGIENDIQQGKSKEEVEGKIKNYRRQQENIAQSTGDIASSLGAIGAFFAIKQKSQTFVAKCYGIDKEQIQGFLNDKGVSKVAKDLKNYFGFKVDVQKLIKTLDKKSTVVALGAAGAFLAGALIKDNLLKLNRIATDQYKPDITPDMDKQETKIAKKSAKKEKRNANFRNFVSGGLNGLTTPIITLGGGLGTIPYVAINSLSRYFVASKEDKGNKSFNSYVDNLKNSPITNIATAGIIAVPAFVKGKGDKIFDKNLDKTLEKLKKANIEQQKIETSYQKLEGIMFADDFVDEVMNSTVSASEKIRKLSDYNIFSLKFKQIGSNDDALAKALKTDCPATRTLEQAQQFLDNAFGKNEYTNPKLVGVGTVAEAYEVTDKEGKTRVVKILKEGINKAKIEKDEQSFIEMINNLDSEKYSTEEKEFLVRTFENIAAGVKGEVDFNNELKAAQELAKYTKQAKVAIPIKVSEDGSAYVMEKASGVSLQDYMFYINNKWEYAGKTKEELSKKIETIESQISTYQQQIKNYEPAKAKMAELEEQYPNINAWLFNDTPQEVLDKYQVYQDIVNDVETAQWVYQGKKSTKINGLEVLRSLISEAQEKQGNIKKYMRLMDQNFDDISVKEAQTLIEKYQDVLVEQFHKVDAKGKVIHGDIHPGNIFIDFKALKEGRKDFFTLIDTGNVINQDQKTALRFLNLTKYIQDADTERITDFVLEGAKLPEGKDMAWAKKEVNEALKKALFDNETYIGKMNNDSMMGLTDDILAQLKIVPSDTQGNLLKSKTAADTSLDEFRESFLSAIGNQAQKAMGEGEDIDIGAGMKEGAKGVGAFAKSEIIYPVKKSAREKRNLFSLPISERAKIKRSKSAPKYNSEDYLTYKLKSREFSVMDLLRTINKE